MISIKAFFKEAIKQQASDVHLVGEEKPMVRIEGALTDLDAKPLSNKELESAIMELLSKQQQAKYNQEHELDFGYDVDGVRFRVNLHQQSGCVGLTARLIPSEIPGPADLHFEQQLTDLPKLLDGLILVTGPTGCGKSTTIASMIEEINKTRKAHVVTVEDPIEFMFKDKMSLIEQREVGADTNSYASALKYVLRQDPNIIYEVNSLYGTTEGILPLGITDSK